MSSSDAEADCLFTGQALAAWVRERSKACHTLPTTAMQGLIRWCCNFVAFLNEQTQALALVDNRHETYADPVMMNYQSDGWSCWTMKHETTSIGSHKFTRIGRKRVGFLLEQTIVKTITARGEVTGSIYATPARSLETLDCWTITQAAWEHFPMLRRTGHKGLIRSVYLQDGMHYTAFAIHSKAKHKLYYTADSSPGDDDEAWQQSNYDVVLGIKCMAHACGNGVKWGTKRFTSESLLKDPHCGIRSLRQTSEQLRNHVLNTSQHDIRPDTRSNLGIPETILGGTGGGRTDGAVV